MSEARLLPPNTTALERAAAQACATLVAIPIPIRDLWNPDRCPEAFLPLLAWQFSVDRWDQDWPAATKRAVIKASYNLHRRKGTILALRRAVEPLGYLIRVVEWWQTSPRGPRGTFTLDVGVLDTGITDEMYAELERLIDDAKPLSRHLRGLAISLEARGSIRIAAAAYLGDQLTVYPYQPGPIEVSGSLRAAGAPHLLDTLSVYPS